MATVAEVNNVVDTANSHERIITNYLTKDSSIVKQLANLFSVKVGESGISVSSDGVLVNGKKIHITGDTLIDNASIDGAKIKSLDASKITAGTLNAANVKIINLDASSITSGTINGERIKISGTSSDMILNSDEGIVFKSKDGNWSTAIGRNSISFEDNSNGKNEKVGRIAFGYSDKNYNINGISVFLTTKQELGAPYGGDVFGIGHQFKLDGTAATDLVYDASGIERRKGFHFYRNEGISDSEVFLHTHLHMDVGSKIYTGGKDPFYVTSVRFGDSSYHYPALTLGYDDESRSKSGVSFRWDDVRPYGVMNMTNAQISVDNATNHISVGWASWSNWHNEKYPAFMNQTGTGGIAFPPSGHTIVFAPDERQNTWKY